jgi:phosphate-selective porin OprO/OprP
MGRIQGRVTHEAINGLGGEGDDADETYFTLQRTRLKMQGTTHSADFAWKFELDFGKDEVSLKDYFFDWNIGAAVLRVGQWKKPFSRQRVTSSGSLEFVDRTPNMNAFNADRDVGFGFHNNYTKSPKLEWAVGIFNGQGPNIVVDNMSPMVVARAGYNHNGIKGYSEADLEGGDLRFGVAASLMSDLGPVVEDETTGEITELDPAHSAQMDFSLKAHGFASTGEVFMSLEEDGNLGAQLQASYLLGGKWQPAVRGVYMDLGDDEVYQEVGAAFSAYLHKHSVKWQSDLSVVLGNEDGEETDLVARSQIQFAF